jgi:hypothetical protein
LEDVFSRVSKKEKIFEASERNIARSKVALHAFNSTEEEEKQKAFTRS